MWNLSVDGKHVAQYTLSGYAYAQAYETMAGFNYEAVRAMRAGDNFRNTMCEEYFLMWESAEHVITIYNDDYAREVDEFNAKRDAIRELAGQSKLDVLDSFIDTYDSVSDIPLDDLEEFVNAYADPDSTVDELMQLVMKFELDTLY